jgi:glutamate N-acetyltransferase/amino-acid N-acetyltransferase
MSIQLIPKKLILPKGFFASGLHSGIKKRKVPDLSLLFSKKPAVAAGVFTTNRVKAWNVKYCQRIMSRAKHHAFLTNSGNANCYNGPSGKKTVEILARQTGQFLKINSASIFVSATGIIGRVFPIEKAVKALPRLVSLLSTQGGHLAALGILTTDRRTKEVTVRFKLGASDVTITGFSKGAGMLHPNMATMLAFFATDAAISKSLLKQAVKETANQSFNRISVDNDMSTNDSVIIMANGLAKNAPIRKRDQSFEKFKQALLQACQYLAKEMVKDGEGVQHVCEIRVEGAQSDREADVAARTLANSMLFKTMLAGSDPNWGRVVAALGSAPAVTANLDHVDLYFAHEPVLKRGKLVARFRGRLHRILKQKEFVIRLNLNHGNKKTVFWTSDLTKKYVHINASYST